MSKLSINTHISREFGAELEDVRRQVLAMGDLVKEQIAAALRALAEGDTHLAEAVIARDVEVDRMEVAIDDACRHILARRQPAASDLRLMITIIKTITDLERIGDEAEKIARMALRLASQNRPINVHDEVATLGASVQEMVHAALDAFARLDAVKALSVAESDAHIDNQYDSILQHTITAMMADTRNIRQMLDVLWAVRALERIGDHSSNICEYTIYLVQGKDVRHINSEKATQDMRKDTP